MAYARLLVPVDFSDHASTAAKLAAAMKRRTGASLTLLHVDRLPPVAARMAHRMRSDVWEAFIDDRNETLRHLLDELRAKLGIDAEVDTVLARDGVATTIGQYARERAADLIVMGSHGVDATGRFLLGSVVSPVAATAPCPVLATRTQHSDRLPVSGGFRRPLIAVDFCANPRAASEVVRELASQDAVVDLVHAWVPRASWLLGAERLPEELARALTREQVELEERIERTADSFALSGLRTSTLVDKGPAADVLVHRLEHGDYDVVVVGARGYGGERGSGLGSVAERVLHSSPAPIVVIPTPGVPC